MDVSIRDMKHYLSKYLKLVRAGKDVVTTDRGKPVAQLTPIKPVTENEEEAIARINALPWVQPGKGSKPTGSRKGVTLRGNGPKAAAMVLQDREWLFVSIPPRMPVFIFEKKGTSSYGGRLKRCNRLPSTRLRMSKCGLR